MAMNKKRAFLAVQSALIIVWVALMALAAVRIFLDGSAYQAQGHPEAWIYTREEAVSVIVSYAPILLAAVAMTAVGSALGIRDERQDQPVKDERVMSLYKAERQTGRDVEAEARCDRGIRRARIIVLVVGLSFVILGIINGSMLDVLIKAVNLCTECVGLG